MTVPLNQPQGVIVKLLFALLFASIFLAGCASTPSFESWNNLPRSASSGLQPDPAGVPTVSDVVDKIQCELLETVQDPNAAFAPLREDAYVADLVFTLQVTDNDAVNPSLSYITPFTAVASTSRNLGINGQYSVQSDRIITLSVLLDLDAEHLQQTRLKDCDSLGKSTGSGFRGGLRLKEILLEGLRHRVDNDFLFPLVSDPPSAKIDNVQALGYQSLVPTFGSTIDFTVTYGVGGGPNWTLAHFAGPTGSSGSLLSYSHTGKNTLVLTFSSAGPRHPPVLPVPEGQTAESAKRASISAVVNAKAQAARSAQNAANRLILQQVLPGL